MNWRLRNIIILLFLTMARNPFITAFGETKRANEWLVDSRCASRTIDGLHNRIFRYGWTPEDAIVTPYAEKVPFNELGLKTGMRFWHLTFTGTVFDYGAKNIIECECVCGKIIKVRATVVVHGATKSCGCKKGEGTSKGLTTHGMSRIRSGKKHPIYSIWCGMKDRCRNKNNNAYKNYGGRGITISEEFLVFDNFLKWSLENGWQDGLTIERERVDEGYNSSNCKWITLADQQRNKRTTRYITAFGETKTIYDWVNDPRCIIKSKSTIYTRLGRMKMTDEQILTVPSKT